MYRAAIAVLAAFGAIGCTGEKASCTSLQDGAWTFDGAALGMPMTAMVTMDVEGCAFEIEEWTMAMNSLPSGGTLVDDQVTLTGTDAIWATCVGTANAEGTEVTGLCEGGEDFSMAVEAM